MKNPYAGLPSSRYWKTGVSDQHPFTIEDLYKKKFNLTPDMQIATAGSCFAQHIGTNLKRSGYRVLDLEPAPRAMSPQTALKYGYGIYSARYGNIYSARQLLQLAKEAFGEGSPVDAIWEKDGRYYDALRPAVEPTGLSSRDEVLQHRAAHLANVRSMLTQMNLFIFTLGLTEAWVHRESGTVYPTAPGTIAGTFDPAVYEFKNFRYGEVLSDMLEFREFIRGKNPSVKFLLTVSPVPLTATATDNHVLVATTYSKSVLRGVAGELSETFKDVDYFPSYELIASPFSRGFFYSPNLRSVEANGVQSVMRVFFDQHKAKLVKGAPSEVAPGLDDVMCEEVLLEAFAK